jgi:hypothetical protein
LHRREFSHNRLPQKPAQIITHLFRFATARPAASRGWSAAKICTPGPICVRSPMANFNDIENHAVEVP